MFFFTHGQVYKTTNNRNLILLIIVCVLECQLTFFHRIFGLSDISYSFMLSSEGKTGRKDYIFQEKRKNQLKST